MNAVQIIEHTDISLTTETTTMDLMGLLGKITLFLSLAAFICGFLITALTGSVKAVKRFLIVIAVLTTLIAIITLVFIKAFIYLLFQYISAIILLCSIIIVGSACGYGFFLLIHRKQPGLNMKEQNITDFMSIHDFVILDGIDQQRAIDRIKSRYYNGGKLDGIWYIHKSELSHKHK